MKAAPEPSRRFSRWLWRAALLSGGAAAGFTLLGAGFAWGFLHPARVRGHGSPADYGLKYETISLTTPDGVRLAAWYVPCPGARAGIIVCHGYRANRQLVASLLPFLHRAGFAVLAFDFRAMGESGGQLCSFGRGEKEDVRAAVQFLRTRPGLEGGRVGVLGLSMGGAAAIMAAAEDPEIGAVVADSTFARLNEMVGERFRGFGQAGPSLAGCTRWWAERMCGFPATAVAPAAVVARLAPRPLLLIHGEEDSYTPVAQSRALYAAAGEPKQLWVVPNAPHVGAHNTATEEYEQRVAAFFRKALLG